MRFLIGETGAAWGDRRRGRAGFFPCPLSRCPADIARRCLPVWRRHPERGAQLPVEVFALFVSFCITVGHTHPDGIATVVGSRRKSCFRSHLIIIGIYSRQEVNGWGQRNVWVLMTRRPGDGLRTRHPRNPDGRMGLLQRHHPWVDHPVVIVFALPAERPWRGPGLEDDVVGLVETLSVVHGVGIGGQTFLPNPPHKTAHHPAPGEDVDHGNLFGHAQGIFVNGQDVAQKDNAAFGGGASQDGPDDVDRGHHAERVVVMLVDHHPIKTMLRAVLELIEVHAVEGLGLFRTEMRIGKHQVIIAKLPGFLLRISRIPHLGEEVDFLNHVGTPIQDAVRPSTPLPVHPRDIPGVIALALAVVQWPPQGVPRSAGGAQPSWERVPIATHRTAF